MSLSETAGIGPQRPRKRACCLDSMNCTSEEKQTVLEHDARQWRLGCRGASGRPSGRGGGVAESLCKFTRIVFSV